MARKALILVDIQNDFCPGGTMGISDADEVLEPANRLAEEFAARGDIVLATKDSHPKNHASFASSHEGAKPWDVIEYEGRQRTLLPDHCIDGTPGAEFHPELRLDLVEKIFKKGTGVNYDSYSGFFDNDQKNKTGLDEYLRENEVEEVWVVGLTSGRCVKATATDAVKHGFKTIVYAPACRASGVEKDGGKQAFEDMAAAGCEVIW